MISVKEHTSFLAFLSFFGVATTVTVRKIRLLPRLEDEQKFYAIRYILIRQSPNHTKNITLNRINNKILTIPVELSRQIIIAVCSRRRENSINKDVSTTVKSASSTILPYTRQKKAPDKPRLFSNYYLIVKIKLCLQQMDALQSLFEQQLQPL